MSGYDCRNKCVCFCFRRNTVSDETDIVSSGSLFCSFWPTGANERSFATIFLHRLHVCSSPWCATACPIQDYAGPRKTRWNYTRNFQIFPILSTRGAHRSARWAPVSGPTFGPGAEVCSPLVNIYRVLRYALRQFAQSLHSYSASKVKFLVSSDSVVERAFSNA